MCISAFCMDFSIPLILTNLGSLLSFFWGKKNKPNQKPMYYLEMLNGSLFFGGFKRLQ